MVGGSISTLPAFDQRRAVRRTSVLPHAGHSTVATRVSSADSITAHEHEKPTTLVVLAGTQGGNNHRKKDRMFEIAEHNRLPVVLLGCCAAGGGRVASRRLPASKDA